MSWPAVKVLAMMTQRDNLGGIVWFLDACVIDLLILPPGGILTFLVALFYL